VVLVINEVSEERIAPINRVTRIGELGTLALTNNACCEEILINRPRCVVPQKGRLIEDPHGLSSQKLAFFIVTAVKTSKLA
jgi:hypothetical protein